MTLGPASFHLKDGRGQWGLAHPDRAAGLGFHGMSCAAFMPLVLAHGVMLAGLTANLIFFVGAKLTDFTMEIIAVVAFLLLSSSSLSSLL
jgi:hypothetical protein